MSGVEFEKLIKQYEKLVFTICYQFVRDYQEAQNLTQETFLSAYTHIDNCSADSYKPWLARIATNKAKDYLKSAYNRHVMLDADDEHSLLDTGQSSDNIYLMTENNDGVNSIREKILNLSEPYKMVSKMFFLEEKNVDEISKTLDRPKKTVQTQIYRARILLQSLLKGEVQYE